MRGIDRMATGGNRHWSAAAAGLLLVLGCASGPAPPPAPETMAKPAYVIGTGDVLSVRVWQNGELSVEVPVRPDGKISVPLVDDVQAEGLTAEELKEVLSRELAEYVANPDVTVVVTRMDSKRAYVIGEVGRPGPVPLTTDLRVLDALSLAGGFNTFADRSNVKILRHTEDGEQEYVFDYDAYVDGEAPGTNVRLAPGDTIVVPD